MSSSYVSSNQIQSQTQDFKESPSTDTQSLKTCAASEPGKITIAGAPQRTRMGNKALSHEQYLIDANLNLVRY